MITNLALGSAVVYKHTTYLFCVADLKLINASRQQTYKSRFNTEMKQGEYLISITLNRSEKSFRPNVSFFFFSKCAH